MALQTFTIEALATIDGGRIAEAFAQALKRLEDDCRDRPALADARRLNLSVSLSPVPHDNGELDSVDVSFKLTDNVPKRQSKTYNMRATRSGLKFNELSPEDARQMTLDDAGMGPRSTADDQEVEEVANAQ